MRAGRTRTPIAWFAFTLCLLLTVAVSVHVAQAERDSEKLRFAVAAMSARDKQMFVGILGHDLRAPLRAVQPSSPLPC
jgi:hypothetical protein